MGQMTDDWVSRHRLISLNGYSLREEYGRHIDRRRKRETVSSARGLIDQNDDDFNSLLIR